MVAAAASVIDALLNIAFESLLLHPERRQRPAEWEGQAGPVLEAVFVAGWVSLAANVVALIAFLVWLYRVRANLPWLGIRDVKGTPATAVACWLVPWVNLYLPYRIMCDIWRASDPLAVPHDWRRRPGSVLLDVWWGTFLLRWGMSMVTFSTWRRNEYSGFLDSPKLLILLNLGFGVVTIAYVILSIRLMRAVDRRQGGGERPWVS